MSCNIVRLCGITSRFQLLSPSTRQVTHALLTRPPLSHIELQTEVICSICFVRLACVKHAASVHPEPGSNSHKNVFALQSHTSYFVTWTFLKLNNDVCLVSYKLTSLNSFTKTYCLGSCIFRYSQDSLMNHFKILKEFQGCLSIQLSKNCIAQTQYLSSVLSLICYRLPRRLVYNIIRCTHCQQLFLFFLTFFIFSL